MDEREKAVQHVSYLLRSSGRWQEPSIIMEKFHEHDVVPTLGEFLNTMPAIDRSSAPSFVPPPLAFFVAKLAKAFGGDNILDPRAGVGSLAFEVARTLPHANVQAFIDLSPFAAVTPQLADSDRINWIQVNSLESLRSVHEKFDIVVSHVPPIRPFGADERESRKLPELIVAESAKVLTESGVGIFLTDRHVVTDERQRERIDTALQKQHCRITDYIQVESDSFGDERFYPAAVIVVRRSNDQRLLVSRYAPTSAVADADLREDGADAFRIVLLELVDDPALLSSLKKLHIEHAHQTCGTYNETSASVASLPIDLAARQAVAEARRRSTAIAVENALAGLERLRASLQKAWRVASNSTRRRPDCPMRKG